MSTFRDRYGPWALVAGASEGLGEQYARQLAAKGLNVVLVARRQAVLDELATKIRADHKVDVRTCAVDLSSPTFLESLRTATDGLEIGLVVSNAAFSVVGDHLNHTREDQLRVVDVNVRALVLLVDQFVRPMADRKRGGLIVMSSLAAFQGGPVISLYAATKAFDLTFAEGLSDELKLLGIDVVAVCAGAIRTKAYLQHTAREAPGTLDAKDVAARAIASLGQRPLTIPGGVNRLASFFMSRLLPRRAAVAIMGKATRGLR